jgi:oxygen-independent coproporphyrinogen-3 oxidase
MPDPDTAADMQLRCQEALARAGYAQYEVSAYARPGRGCRHNLNYWQFGDYLGIGAGAHGKRTRQHDTRLLVERSTREREPRRYLAALSGTGAEPAWSAVPPTELPFEFMMNALRLVEGFEERDFEQRTGLGRAVLDEPLGRACARGLIRGEAQRWRATPLGFNFLNDLLVEFLGKARDSRVT